MNDDEFNFAIEMGAVLALQGVLANQTKITRMCYEGDRHDAAAVLQICNAACFRAMSRVRDAMQEISC